MIKKRNHAKPISQYVGYGTPMFHNPVIFRDRTTIDDYSYSWNVNSEWYIYHSNGPYAYMVGTKPLTQTRSRYSPFISIQARDLL